MMEKSPIDKYTVAHFLFGVLGKRAGWKSSSIVILAVGYEIIEPTIIEKIPLWNKEGPSNIGVDVLAAWLGSRLVK